MTPPLPPSPELLARRQAHLRARQTLSLLALSALGGLALATGGDPAPVRSLGEAGAELDAEAGPRCSAPDPGKPCGPTPGCSERCATGDTCRTNDDCASGACDPASTRCAAAITCADNKKNGLETDVDCGGGTCPKCANDKACAAGTDCASGLCDDATKKCKAQTAAPTCTDTARNGLETDVDCGGGTCPKCAEGKACAVDLDCTTGLCDATAKTCKAVPASCSDTVKNGTETDIDCGGGTCPKCADSKACTDAVRDCTSGVCTGGSCQAPTYTDGVKNGTETDVDCGGPGVGAPKCADSKACALASDCTSGVCGAGNVCVSRCDDGVKNGLETDVDCGGGTCPKCSSDGTKACTDGARDCTSGVCTGNLCVTPAPRCDDGIKNGAETDVDCGGGTCPRCSSPKACAVDTDCFTSHCATTPGPGLTCQPCIRTETNCGTPAAPSCSDTRFDPMNCGGCGVCNGPGCTGRNCFPPAACSASMCCGPGTAACGGACVSTENGVGAAPAIQHCGGCNACINFDNDRPGCNGAMCETACNFGRCIPRF